MSLEILKVWSRTFSQQELDAFQHACGCRTGLARGSSKQDGMQRCKVAYGGQLVRGSAALCGRAEGQERKRRVGNNMQRVKILGFLLVQQDPTQL